MFLTSLTIVLGRVLQLSTLPQLVSPKDAAPQDDWDIRVGKALSSTIIIQAGNSMRDRLHGELLNSSRLRMLKLGHMCMTTHIINIREKLSQQGLKGVFLWGYQFRRWGGADTVSPTFGAGLWNLDYGLKVAVTNMKRTYFYHGTLGACYYCWWGRYTIASPYYGAYVATAAIAGGSYIAALDDGSTNHATYVIYDSTKKPLRAVLINSDYYETGTGGSQALFLRA
ncbi:Beta-glucuronidase [Penicillium canariense]|uniref:Beta-glucuronidase n=1 Tax=Penicillium canariense TaxID=189055 RepID=A0A9W9HUE6_9EURO|nr:Beta-glucuronidase [Penicillium canariense]KAJ5157928.1 Beta-glucuronidase [Penicillium canariense]